MVYVRLFDFCQCGILNNIIARTATEAEVNFPVVLRFMVHNEIGFVMRKLGCQFFAVPEAVRPVVAVSAVAAEIKLGTFGVGGIKGELVFAALFQGKLSAL